MRRFLIYLAFLLLLALIGGLLGGTFLAVRCVVLQGEIVRDCYYVEWVTEMIILHLDANHQQWPESWEDLRDDHAKCENLASRLPWSLTELSENVSVDWLMNTAELKAQAAEPDHPKLQFISLKNGRKVYWSGGEPNQMVCEYLLGQRKPLSGRN